MKVGDILICKSKYRNLIINQDCSIHMIDKDNTILVTNYHDGSYWFTLVPHKYGCFLPYIWEHFYTKKEYRKLKLRQLND